MNVNSSHRARPENKLKVPRPRRGSPEQTRERLIAAAARIFNRAGYYGTDSNRIAKEAGYSPGTFYKHFRNKREIFLAAYEAWVSAEWEAVANELFTGKSAKEKARRLVALSIEFHTRWRGLRASLQELVFTDPDVQQFYRKQRRKQLDVMAELRARTGGRPRSREEDAIHLFKTERTYDALARGELKEIGVDRGVVIESMIEEVHSMLRPRK